MKNIIHCIALSLALMILAACGGGGGGSSETPATTYTLTYAAGTHGTLTGTTTQTVNSGASASLVTAVPASGYHFVNWTEGSNTISTNAALTITNVTANHSYTANFAANTLPKTTATVKINLTGTLPSSTTISGTEFTITLPADVTPALTNGAVANGVVSCSGTFNGSTLAPQVVYTAATSTLHLILTSSVPAGVTQIGEVATITLQLANNATPTAANFTVSADSVFDATLYGAIAGMGVSVASVTLQ